VFSLFFLLVVILGLFSIWRLSLFSRLSTDVAAVWLPTTRVLGDLNNFTSDFRAIEGSELLSTNAAGIADAQQMAALDRAIANAERGFERLRHDAAEDELYGRFKARWNAYRAIVNRMLALSRTERRAEAVAIYRAESRAAYEAASDTLGQLTDQVVASAQRASDRLAGAYWQAIWLIVAAMVFAAVLVAAALIHVSRSISAPLRALASRMRLLAANDTAAAIPATDRQDEIGEMAQATVVFRQNAIELMRSQRTLARQAALLEEQLAHEQRLALLQRNFVSMASHEFRTPLTNIDGHARRLMKLKDTVRPPDIAERAGKIRAAVLRLTHLIDNLINSARLTDGDAAPFFDPVTFDVLAVLRDVCQLHREMVPGVVIREHLARQPAMVFGDAKLLFQAFSNLLSNAVKYSPAGSTIDVVAETCDDEMAVTVADHGIGIPGADLPRLFERYYRGSNVSGIVGTGVGLYLVKVVIDLHAGAIDVSSSEGEGSRFTIRLPVQPPAAMSDGATDASEAVDAPPIALVSTNDPSERP
jgi:signal transduction histidine kinase